MSTIQAREYASAGEMQAHAAQLRRRMFQADPAAEARIAAVQEARRRQEAEAAERARVARERAAQAAAEALEQDRLRIQAQLAESGWPERMARHPRTIITKVAEAHGLTYADVVGPSRKVPVMTARYEAIKAVLDVHPKMSTPQLGRHFGGRDHTTMLHAIRRIAGLTATQIRQHRAAKTMPQRQGGTLNLAA